MRKLAAAALIVALLFVHLSCGGMAAKPDAALGEVPSKGPVGKTFKANGEKFLVCARDAVSIQTGSQQTIDLRFFVTPDGNVAKARIENMTSPDPDLYTCVLKALKKLHFPPPKDGHPKEIKFPLVLKPE